MNKKDKEELKHFKYTGIPRCVMCHKNFINIIDSKTKKLSKYAWKPNCRCYKKPIGLMIG